VTSATRGVSRPLSHGLFLIRDKGRILRDSRVEVGPQYLEMLSKAAKRRTLLLLYYRADVRLGATYAAREGA
jgi:hypothetical protein